MQSQYRTNSNKSLGLVEPHSSFRFQYRLFTMTTFFEIAVYYAKSILTVINHLGWLNPTVPFGSSIDYLP